MLVNVSIIKIRVLLANQAGGVSDSSLQEAVRSSVRTHAVVQAKRWAGHGVSAAAAVFPRYVTIAQRKATVFAAFVARSIQYFFKRRNCEFEAFESYEGRPQGVKFLPGADICDVSEV